MFNKKYSHLAFSQHFSDNPTKVITPLSFPVNVAFSYLCTTGPLLNSTENTSKMFNLQAYHNKEKTKHPRFTCLSRSHISLMSHTDSILLSQITLTTYPILGPTTMCRKDTKDYSFIILLHCICIAVI